MNETIIIVADGGLARFYRLEPVEAPRMPVRLIETALLQHPDLKPHSTTGRPPTETNTNRQAGPVHPMGAQRERHRLDHERHFAHDVAQGAVAATRGWKQGTVVLVAEPRMLGLLRGQLRGALHEGIALKELAKDYMQLEAPDLFGRLVENGVIANPVRPGS